MEEADHGYIPYREGTTVLHVNVVQAAGNVILVCKDGSRVTWPINQLIELANKLRPPLYGVNLDTGKVTQITTEPVDGPPQAE